MFNVGHNKIKISTKMCIGFCMRYHYFKRNLFINSRRCKNVYFSIVLQNYTLPTRLFIRLNTILLWVFF